MSNTQYRRIELRTSHYSSASFDVSHLALVLSDRREGLAIGLINVILYLVSCNDALSEAHLKVTARKIPERLGH
jgi:hypothetical protein